MFDAFAPKLQFLCLPVSSPPGLQQEEWHRLRRVRCLAGPTDPGRYYAHKCTMESIGTALLSCATRKSCEMAAPAEFPEHIFRLVVVLVSGVCILRIAIDRRDLDDDLKPLSARRSMA